MVEIKKIDNKNIKIDGKEISIDKYNSDGFSNHPIMKEFGSLGVGSGNGEGYFWSRKNPETGEYYGADEYVKEMAKSKKVHLNLWNKINQGLHESRAEFNNSSYFNTLMGHDSEEKMKEIIEKNNRWLQDNLPWFTEMVNDMNQLKSQLEATGNEWGNDYNDPNKDKTHEELDKKAKEIGAYREKVKGEIENALNQDPKITNEELEPSNRNWQDQIWNTLIVLGEKEIDNIKNRVLADIEAKRTAKTGKRKREDEENEIPNNNKKPRSEDLNSELEKLRNKELGEVDKNDLAAVVKVSEGLEGEKEYEDKKEEIKLNEAELIKKDPELYKQTIIFVIKQRIEAIGLKDGELDEETKNLINNQITDVEVFRETKIRVMKKLGESQAKSKWTDLFDRAKKTLDELKNSAAKKGKETLKVIKQQIKDLKSSTNTYLQSYLADSDNKQKLEKLERDLESYSNKDQTNAPDNNLFWKIAIPVSLVAVLAAVVAIVVVRRKRKQAQAKGIKVKEIVE